MRKLGSILLVSILLIGCTKTYEHTLVLDNNSNTDIVVISFSSNPEFADTLSLKRGAETVLFHSENETYANLNCLANIDSFIVTPSFGQFQGNMLDESSWTSQKLDRSYKQLTFCTFVFDLENVN